MKLYIFIPTILISVFISLLGIAFAMSLMLSYLTFTEALVHVSGFAIFIISFLAIIVVMTFVIERLMHR